MKKILLFICMVMCVVGTKAQTYSTSMVYNYSNATGFNNYQKTFVGIYNVLRTVDTDDQMINSYVSGMSITSVKVDGTERLSNLTKTDATYYRNYYSSTYGVDIYFFNTSNGNVSFGSSQTSLNAFKNATVDTNASNNYQYGFTIGFSRAQATTYVIEGTIVFYYKGTQSYTRTFKITISPNSAYTNAMKIGGSTSNISTLTALQSGSYTSSSSSSGMRTIKISSATDLSGNSIATSNASVSSSSTGTGTSYTYSSSGSHVFYFKASRSGKFTVKVSQPGYSSYFPCEATLVITVNRATSSMSGDDVKSQLSSGSYSKTLSTLISSHTGSGSYSYSIYSASNNQSVSSFVSGTDYYISNGVFYAKKPGEYKIQVTQATDNTYNSSTMERTITVYRQTDPLAFSSQSFDTKQGKKSFDLASAISKNPSSGAITYSCSDANVTISNGKLTVKKPGTYTISATQAQTDIYEAATSKSFTITASPSKLKKVHSCIINDYQMSEWYDGGNDATWTKNSPNLRYVNPNTLLNTEAYIASGVEKLTGNHTVVKFSDAPTSALITSKRVLINANNKIISDNPTFCDDDKYDFVVPGNAAIQLRDYTGNAVLPAKGMNTVDNVTDYNFSGNVGDGNEVTIINGKQEQKVTYTRSASLIANPGHYSTICLPFSVPAANMPEGFTFEEHIIERKPEATSSPTVFNFAFQTVTSLEAGKPYIFKRNDELEKADMTIEVPAANCTFVSQPDMTDPYFYGTFINLITKDLHGETLSNPYNNGDESVSLSELDTYFTNMYDETNKRVAYFIKQNGDHDEIRRAANNVSMRPLRAYFRFNEANDLLALNGQQAKLMVIHFDNIDDDPTGVSHTVKQSDGYVDVYTISGTLVAKHRLEADALEGLNAGAYILSNGKKIVK